MDGNELARHLWAQPETADTVRIAVTGHAAALRALRFLLGQPHMKMKGQFNAIVDKMSSICWMPQVLLPS
jgi:hypothetical protein